MEKSNEQKGKDDAPSQNKEYRIIINGREHVFEGKKISYEEVVRLAYGKNGDMSYTVSYSKGDDQKPKGTLVPSEEVRVKDGMIFNVTPTYKS